MKNNKKDQHHDSSNEKDVTKFEHREIKNPDEMAEESSGSKTADRQQAPKKPWIAALLSFIMPGLGHVYAGKMKQAVLYYFGFIFIAFSIRFFAFRFIIFAGLIAAMIIVCLFVMADAFLTIKRNPQLISGKHDKWYVYVLNIIFQSMLLGMLPSNALNNYAPITLLSMPTPSMSPTMEPGDCVAFARTKDVKQNDVVVFKYPEDTKTLYCKRCIGTPGDSLKIKEGIAYINDKIIDDTGKLKYEYIIQTNGEALNRNFLERYEITMTFDYSYHALMTEKQAHEISKIRVIKNIEKTIDTEAMTGVLFPKSDETGWTTDNYGPVYIPQKGKSIQLTTSNVYLYGPVIRYENSVCSINGSTVKVNNEAISSYSFKEDYYFVLGDNRHNSLDSRYWGFLPANYITGKGLYVYWSKNKDRIGLKVE